MGKHAAPNQYNIFMGDFERKHIYVYLLHLHIDILTSKYY